MFRISVFVWIFRKKKIFFRVGIFVDIFWGPIKTEYFLVFNVGKRVIFSDFQQFQIYLGVRLNILIFLG